MIDPRAVIDGRAKISGDVTIGPFSIVGPDVEIGSGTWVGPHVIIHGPTRIGQNNKIYQFSSIGDIPQDKKYAGEDTVLDIGDRNVIREYCTFNRGTIQGGGITRVGSDNWIMAYVHIAHDCNVGNNTIFANGATLAGHVYVQDNVILGAFTVVHQFCRIGAYSFSGMATVIKGDVPPFAMLVGNPARPHGVNVEGMKRNGFNADQISNIRRAHKVLYKSGFRLEEAVEKISAGAEDQSELKCMVEFLSQQGRPLVR